MDLIPILSTIILIATIITLVIAIAAYVVFRIKEKQRGQAKNTVQVNLGNPTAADGATANQSANAEGGSNNSGHAPINIIVEGQKVNVSDTKAPTVESQPASNSPSATLSRAQSILAAAIPSDGSAKPAEQPKHDASEPTFRIYKPPTPAGRSGDSNDMWK